MKDTQYRLFQELLAFREVELSLALFRNIRRPSDRGPRNGTAVVEQGRSHNVAQRPSLKCS